MDPIEIEAPDGTIVEFPAGTSDDVIAQAMAAQFGGPDQPAEDLPGLSQREDGTIRTRDTWAGVNEAQARRYQEDVEAGKIDPRAPEGSPSNPYVIPAGGLSEEAMAQLNEQGKSYITLEGEVMNRPDEMLGFQAGVMQPLDNAAGWLESGAEKIGLPVDAINAFGESLGMAGSAEEARNDREIALAQAAAEGRVPGKIGQVAGNVAATIPLSFVTKNPWALGAGEAALTSNADTAGGLAADVALGALSGKVGDVAVKSIGTAINPMLGDVQRRLVDQGVELSPGQLLGGLSHKAEDASTGIWGIGDVLNESQRRAQHSMNRVAVQRPLTDLGVEIPQRVANGSVHDMVGFAQGAVSQAYDDLIPQLDIRLDQQFGQQFRPLYQSVMNGNEVYARQFHNLIENEIKPRFNSVPGAANGRMTGESFKEIDEILKKEVRDYTGINANPNDRRYADAVRELRSQFMDMLARTNPQAAGRLNAVNGAYRQLAVLESAANMAPAGRRGSFTAAQLETAARNADPSVRRRAAAAGDALFQDLSQDAGEVMTRTVADSGTATRGAMTALVGAGLFGGAIKLNINPWAVGAIAAGAAAYSRPGNRLFTAALSRRPSFAGPIRQAVDSNSYLAALASSSSNTQDRDQFRVDAQHYTEDDALRQNLGMMQ